MRRARKRAGARRRPRRMRWEKGAAREKTWKGSQGEVEALRRDPLRSFTRIDPSSKPGVTRPKGLGSEQGEGRAGCDWRKMGAANDASRARTEVVGKRSSARLDETVRRALGSAHLPGGHYGVCQAAISGA